MKRRTRPYARRQLTWMRKLPGVRARRRQRTATPDEAAAEIGRHDAAMTLREVAGARATTT